MCPLDLKDTLRGRGISQMISGVGHLADHVVIAWGKPCDGVPPRSGTLSLIPTSPHGLAKLFWSVKPKGMWHLTVL
jgi:hypothetical protein